MIVVDNFNVYFGIVVNAIFTGVGSGIGIYIAQAHIISKGKKLKKKIMRRFKNG